MARLILLCIFPLINLAGTAQKKELQIYWQLERLDPAFARMAKLQVIIDDTIISESGTFSMTGMGSWIDSLTVGTHQLEIRLFVRQSQGWELHSSENDYAIDAIEFRQIEITDNAALIWHLNVVEQSSFWEWVPPKVIVARDLIPVYIHTRFSSIPEGYDHLSRIRIYGNDRLLETGDVMSLSKERQERFLVPAPLNNVRVVLEVNFRGEWEEHTLFNGYQFDLIWKTSKLKRSRKLYWNGDIMSGYLHFEEIKKGLPK
jgi:hypothetical protein